MTVVGAYLLAGHVFAMPTPPPDAPALGSGLEGARPPGQKGWFALHVIYGECGCSRRIVEHLVARRPRADVGERIALVGNDPTLRAALTAAGYEVEGLEMDQLQERYGISAVPTLAVLGPDDTVRYVGGYTRRKRGPAIADDEILDGLLAGDQPEQLPVFGCAISRELRNATDPLGLRK